MDRESIGSWQEKSKHIIKTSVEKYTRIDQESAIRNSFLITCNAAYRGDVLELVNGFDSNLRYGGDDIDVGIRWVMN